MISDEVFPLFSVSRVPQLLPVPLPGLATPGAPAAWATPQAAAAAAVAAAQWVPAPGPWVTPAPPPAVQPSQAVVSMSPATRNSRGRQNAPNANSTQNRSSSGGNRKKQAPNANRNRSGNSSRGNGGNGSNPQNHNAVVNHRNNRQGSVVNSAPPLMAPLPPPPIPGPNGPQFYTLPPAAARFARPGQPTHQFGWMAPMW